MDRVLVAAGVVAVLSVALVCAVWFLVALNRKERRCRGVPSSHVFRGQGEAVTVAELLEEARGQGDGIRLNWTSADEARASKGPWLGLRPYAQNQIGTVVIGNVEASEDEWPTVILPKLPGDQKKCK